MPLRALITMLTFDSVRTASSLVLQMDTSEDSFIKSPDLCQAPFPLPLLEINTKEQDGGLACLSSEAWPDGRLKWDL